MSVVDVDTVVRMALVLRLESLPLGCRSRPVSVQFPLPGDGEMLRSLLRSRLAPEAARCRRDSKLLLLGEPSGSVSPKYMSFFTGEDRVMDEEDDCLQ